MTQGVATSVTRCVAPGRGGRLDLDQPQPGQAAAMGCGRMQQGAAEDTRCRPGGMHAGGPKAPRMGLVAMAGGRYSPPPRLWT